MLRLAATRTPHRGRQTPAGVRADAADPRADLRVWQREDHDADGSLGDSWCQSQAIEEQ